MILRAISLAAVLTVGALPALAASISAPWNTGVMRKADGSFAYCVSEAQYDNGLWLILALNASGDVNVGVGQRGAQLPVGGERLSTLQIEGQAAQQFPARVTKPDLYVINIGRNNTILDALAAGTRLQVDSNSFTLSGTAQAVEILRECVRVTAATAASTAADPASTVPAPPPSDWRVAGQPAPVEAPAVSAPVAVPATAPVPALAPSRVVIAPEIAVPLPTPKPQQETPLRAPLQLPPELEIPVVVTPPVVVATPAPAPAAKLAPELAVPEPKIEFAPAPATTPAAAAAPAAASLPEPLAKLLARAGLKEVVARPALTGEAYAWRAGALQGELREVSVVAGAPLDKLVAADLAQLRALCTGTFSATPGKSEVAQGLSLASAQSTCTVTGQSVFSAHVYTLTSTGILSAATHMQSGGQAAAERAQSGLLKALKTSN